MDFSINRYEQVYMLHIILMVVTVVLVLWFYVLVVRPHVRKVRREAVAVAGLLSHTPREMDVVSHVRGVLRQYARSKLTKRPRN